MVTETVGFWYLEDLETGQRFTSDWYVMEAERIKQFAAELDPQPFHLDETSKPQGMVTVPGTMRNQ